MLAGESVWVKPLKFQIALAIFLATLAWFGGWLPAWAQNARWRRGFSILVALCIAVEMIWIGGAAAFGVASHFNISTPFMATVYGVMGVAAVTLTSPALVYGVILLRDGESRLSAPFRWSVGLSLVATFVLTVITAGYMAQTGSHLVGAAATDAGGFPIFGWSRDGGDLRVAHFFATHALHFVPVVGYLGALLLPNRPAFGLSVAATAAYAAFVVYCFIDALAGRPFLPSFT